MAQPRHINRLMMGCGSGEQEMTVSVPWETGWGPLLTQLFITGNIFGFNQWR